ncbi:DUF2239 family protein [Microvirga sp. GCM10011540]|uniref:DUF2239 family protein n=1 Tax=Microvirga sp. GCM10011540 TaxID=3317338 RepID=UPI0036227B8C
MQSWAAFQGERCLLAGSPREVAAAVKLASDLDDSRPILIFDNATGRQIDIDLRGSLTDMLSRLPDSDAEAEVEPPQSRGPGRPKLGVVAREVTLLPRHWEWLSAQPGGASVALRKLVDAARGVNAAHDRARRAREVTDQFMAVLAGNQPGYEEAARALYAGDRSAFRQQIESWPPDVRRHVLHLARDAFDPNGALGT